MNQSTIISFLQYRLPALAWGLFIYIVSSIPQDRLPSLILSTDKLVHAGVFLILCWLLHVAFFFQNNTLVRSKSLWIALILTSFFGLTDEYHQLFTPGRSSDLLDWCFDTLGAVAYIILYTKYKFYDALYRANA